MRFQKLALALAIGLLGFGLSATAKPDAKPYWSGPLAQGFQLRWTKNDIQATQNGTVVYSQRAQTLPTFKRWAQEGLQDWKTIDKAARHPRFEFEFEETASVLSATGTYLSLRLDHYAGTNEQAHPAAYIDYKAIDLTRPKHALSLTELFPDKDVLQALLQDSLVKTALARGGFKTRFTTTQALIKLLYGQSVVLVANPGSDCGEYRVPENVMEQFAFHHVNGNKVGVRLALTYNSEVCRGSYAELGLMLPIPERLAPALAASQSKKAGFLMADQPKLPAGAGTNIRFSNMQP